MSRYYRAPVFGLLLGAFFFVAVSILAPSPAAAADEMAEDFVLVVECYQQDQDQDQDADITVHCEGDFTLNLEGGVVTLCFTEMICEGEGIEIIIRGKDGEEKCFTFGG